MPETLTRTPKALLEEALGLIVATYWTRNAEFRWAPESVTEHVKEVEMSPRLRSSRMSPIERDGKSYVRVSSVCSIGAISLARSIVDQKPLADFSWVFEHDPIAAAAAYALADTITSTWPYYTTCFDPAGVIISWNDVGNTTREMVVAAFEAAVEHPLATAAEVWSVAGTHSQHHGVWFPDEAGARRYVEELTTDITGYLECQHRDGTTAGFQPQSSDPRAARCLSYVAPDPEIRPVRVLVVADQPTDV